MANRVSEISPETKKLNNFHGNYKNYLREKERDYLRAKNLRIFQEKQTDEIRKKLKKVYFHNENYKPQMKDGDKMSFNYRGLRYKKSQKRIINQLKNKRNNLEDNLVEIPFFCRRKFELRHILKNERDLEGVKI
jgi:hypothetical protein